MNLEPVRIADADRDRAIELLQGHHAAGRLDSGELDDRCAEVLAARTDHDLGRAMRELPPPAPPARQDTSAATTSLILGLTGLTLWLFSVGALSIITLPISATAWAIGRGAQRRGLSTTGMWTGIAGTALSALGLAAWVSFFILL